MGTPHTPTHHVGGCPLCEGLREAVEDLLAQPELVSDGLVQPRAGAPAVEDDVEADLREKEATERRGEGRKRFQRGGRRKRGRAFAQEPVGSVRRQDGGICGIRHRAAAGGGKLPGEDGRRGGITSRRRQRR